MFKRKPKSDKPAAAAKPAKDKKPKAKREKPKKVVTSAVAIKKAPSDIYTAMLVLSLVAVLTSCVLLLLELNRYGSFPWWKAG